MWYFKEKKRAVPFVILALAAILFSTVGIHFLHPFFHHHYCPEDIASSALSDSQVKTPVNEPDHIINSKEDHCPICSFLLHFHLYQVVVSLLLRQLAACEEFVKAILFIFIKQVNCFPVQPRGPPVFSFLSHSI